jgi:hypothetical protein
MSIYTVDLSTYKQNFKVSKEDKLEYGEIYTPFQQINKMLDLFEPHVFTEPDKKWLDVGAGQGYFSMCLFERLNKGLTQVLPNEEERKKHIIENMLFMIEIKENNIVALKTIFGAAANILHADFLAPSPWAEPSFDYIIGNPPYNSHGMKKVPTNKQINKKKEGSTIWSLFIIKSLELLKPETGKLCMIIPSLWLKPDKGGIHNLLTRYKIDKLHCLNSNETNALFKGEAQTPTCFFLLTKSATTTTTTTTDNIISLFDANRQTYVPFAHKTGQSIPVFGATIINKLQPWVKLAGDLKVKKTNMPPINSKFTEEAYSNAEYPYANITTCVLEGLQPVLLMNYSTLPQSFHGQKKLILAHKMYGFPYFDQHGNYGISNRDNYVITEKTDKEFKQLQSFLSTKFALYLFEAARYRMKYLEKYAFEFIPDITRLSGFPSAEEISEESVADYFGLDAIDKQHIQTLHRKKYKRFI